MRKFITVLSLTAAVLGGLSISGCNTMRGFGKDVERGGERVQDAAKPKPDSTQQKAKQLRLQTTSRPACTRHSGDA